jgi:hypothetical protein
MSCCNLTKNRNIYVQNTTVEVTYTGCLYWRRSQVNIFCVRCVKPRKSMMVFFSQRSYSRRYKWYLFLIILLYYKHRASTCDEVAFVVSVCGATWKSHIYSFAHRCIWYMFGNVEQFFSLSLSPRTNLRLWQAFWACVNAKKRSLCIFYERIRWTGCECCWKQPALCHTCSRLVLLGFYTLRPKYYRKGGLSLEAQRRNVTESDRITFQCMCFRYF